MATTQNNYTGNGSNKLFSITFPYLETTDIFVFVNGTATTAYSFANATTIEMTTAPANGATVAILRSTDDANLQATFYPGSSIKASDLNNDFDQILFIAQETTNQANTATITAGNATTTANTALSNSSAAVSTANTASSNASAAVATANTANTNASNAVTTANTASTNASTAITTANAAVVTANAASSSASAAVSTANTASSNASAAVSTANTASTNASAAVTTANAANSTANTASTNASNAVGVANAATATANTASANASAAVTTANAAQADATNAIAAVSAASLYVIVANVAAIPTTGLTNNQGIQVTDTTGLESFTPLSGIPVGFVGNAALYARIRYSTSTSSWVWVDYAANDPEGRYLAKTGGTMTGALVLSGAPTVGLNPTTKTYVDAADSTLTTAAAAAQSTANAALPKAGGTVTGNLEIGTTGSLTFEGATADGFETTLAVVDPTTDRTITLPNVTGTVVTTGDTGTVTSNMILDGTIVNGDIGALAAISGTKIDPDFGSQNISTNGTVRLAAGSATEPRLTFSGDTNTGIYSPGADQFGISTGGTSRVIVDASGNVNIDSNTLYVDSVNNRIGLGTPSPAVTLDVSATDAIRVAAGTTGQRPTGAAGMLRYNSSLSQFEGYGVAWGTIGGGAKGGGSDDVFYENAQTVTTNYSITAGKNAMTAGPVTVNSGVTVTVPTGSFWSII